MYASDHPLDTDYSGRGPLLPPEGSDSLRKAGKWGRFLGIVSMVTVGLMVAFLVLMGGTLLSIGGQNGSNAAAWMLPLVIFYGAMFALMLYLAYLLYHFGAKAMIAVDTGSSTAMTASFGSLGRLLKILGILTVIQLVFMGISIAIMLFTGAAGLMNAI